jgi:hypothetical protein
MFVWAGVLARLTGQCSWETSPDLLNESWRLMQSPAFAGEGAPAPHTQGYFLGLSSFMISATMLSMVSLTRLSGRLKLFDRMENATRSP